MDENYERIPAYMTDSDVFKENIIDDLVSDGVVVVNKTGVNSVGL